MPGVPRRLPLPPGGGLALSWAWSPAVSAPSRPGSLRWTCLQSPAVAPPAGGTSGWSCVQSSSASAPSRRRALRWSCVQSSPVAAPSRPGGDPYTSLPNPHPLPAHPHESVDNPAHPAQPLTRKGGAMCRCPRLVHRRGVPGGRQTAPLASPSRQAATGTTIHIRRTPSSASPAPAHHRVTARKDSLPLTTPRPAPPRTPAPPPRPPSPSRRAPGTGSPGPGPTGGGGRRGRPRGRCGRHRGVPGPSPPPCRP